jgi:hypothetical protein
MKGFGREGPKKKVNIKVTTKQANHNLLSFLGLNKSQMNPAAIVPLIKPLINAVINVECSIYYISFC